MKRLGSPFRWLFMLLACFAVLLIGWKLANPSFTTEEPSSLGLQGKAVASIRRAAVWKNEIVPNLVAFECANAESTSRALEILHERFAMHRAGIQPFVRDVSSWRTRFGVMRRLAGDSYVNHVVPSARKTFGYVRSMVSGTTDTLTSAARAQASDQANAYINAKFRQHILSEDALTTDIADVLSAFRAELEANRNTLYASVRLPLERIQSPVASTDAVFARFQEQAHEETRALALAAGLDSVSAGVAGFAGGWVAQDITTILVARLLASVTVGIGTNAVAAGGATAGTASTGAAGGSLAGPAGTLIGLGIGIVVGIAIDWWMSDRFATRMTKQLEDYLVDVEGRIANGNGKLPGLKYQLLHAVDIMNRGQRQAFGRLEQEVSR